MVARAIAVVVLALFVLPVSVGAQDEMPYAITLEVQVCEGEEFGYWFNAAIADNKKKCVKPLPDVPLDLGTAGHRFGPVNTDSKGAATIGPLTIGQFEECNLVMGCRTHMCLTLKYLSVAEGPLNPGENKLLICTIPQPGGGKAEEMATSDPE